MYKSMLFLHWKQVRPALALAVIASFGLPVMAVEGLGTAPGMSSTSLDAYRFVSTFEDFLWFFPLLALGIGVTVALSAWNWDHQHRHVYALSLPMTRWEYTLQKLLAGMTLCAIPALGMWAGAHVATLAVDLPTGLNAYPNEVAFRFLFAILISYALFFALAAGTIRTTLIVVGAAMAFVFLGTILNDVLATWVPYFEEHRVVENVLAWMMTAPGPFEVFSGNWALIDV